jgi:hypothetical protein
VPADVRRVEYGTVRRFTGRTPLRNTLVPRRPLAAETLPVAGGVAAAAAAWGVARSDSLDDRAFHAVALGTITYWPGTTPFTVGRLIAALINGATVYGAVPYPLVPGQPQ